MKRGDSRNNIGDRDVENEDDVEVRLVGGC